MSELRNNFESLPNVKSIFDGLHPTIIWFSDAEEQYATSFVGFDKRVTWLNGAWHVFQSQQAKIDELQKKYDAMYNAFVVADDCRKEWHRCYIGVRQHEDELQARIDKAMKYVSESPLKDVSRRAMINFMDILKGNKD